MLRPLSNEGDRQRYGGLSNLGEKHMKTENFELALDEVVWLITLLANQSVLVHNLQNPSKKRELLTEDTVELLTSPLNSRIQKRHHGRHVQRNEENVEM
jgi:hypothetical protein